MTGWNLPPGCTYAMLDEACGVGVLCQVCGNDCDDCVCPECPVCGVAGDPDCYKAHGMVLSAEQLAGQAEAERRDREQAEADAAEAAYWADPQRKVEEAEFHALIEEEADRAEREGESCNRAEAAYWSGPTSRSKA